MYAVMQQRGTDAGHRHYLEFADEYPEDPTIDPATVVVFHRRLDAAREAAWRIARAMGMPAGSYPELWANISAHEVARHPLYYVVRD